MAFQVNKLFLRKHNNKSKEWDQCLGSQRYEIRVMEGFFRNEVPDEQIKESRLIALAGTYIYPIKKFMPVIAVPNMRENPDSKLKIIDIVRSRDYESIVYQSVKKYAKIIAKERGLEFCDLTSKNIE